MLIGTIDSKIHMYSTLSWKETFSYTHNYEKLTTQNTSDLLNIYQETDSNDGIYYEALQRPFTIPVAGKGKGVSQISLSQDGRYIAVKTD
jgi:hypothetical protein